jgi:anti-sigma factor RsiW
MRCAQIDRHLERFVDGELDIELTQQIEAHLRSCTRCIARVDAARALLKGLGAPAERAPAGFASRVMAAVYREGLAEGPRLSRPESLKTHPALLPAQRIYRRLGLSLVLTAGILGASLFIPRAAYTVLLGSGSAAGGLSRESAVMVPRGFGAAVQSALNGADSVVRGILREQANGGSVR